MSYAIVPLVQAGPVIRGQQFWRPLGYDRSPHSFIAIRFVDGRRRAFIWFDDPVIDAQVIKIADDKAEILGAVSRTALTAYVSDRVVRTISWQDTLVDLLKTPPADWRHEPLRAGTDGYRIWLGPGSREFYAEAVAQPPHSQRFLDTFTRADATLNGSTLSGGGSTWTSYGWTVSSNQARAALPSSFSFFEALTTTECDTDSEAARVALVAFTRDPLDALAFRLHINAPTGLASGYDFLGFQNPDAGGGRAIRAISGAIDLANDTTVPVVGTYEIRRDGSSVSVLLDAAVILGPVTDTGEASGAGKRHVGFNAESEDITVGSSVTLDNFEGGDYPVTRRFVLIPS